MNMLKVLFAIFMVLISCSKKPVANTYFESDKTAVLPDSAKVKAVISVSHNDKNEKLSTVLFVVPNKRYRLELSGTMGVSAVSILWKQDEWKIIFPQDERYMKGEGNCISIPVYGYVDIHKFAALFFGQRIDALGCGEWDALDLEYVENSALVSSGKDSLRLEIKNIDSKAKWSAGVWNLSIPDKYVIINQHFLYSP